MGGWKFVWRVDSSHQQRVCFLPYLKITKPYTWFDEMHPDSDGFLAWTVSGFAQGAISGCHLLVGNAHSALFFCMLYVLFPKNLGRHFSEKMGSLVP